jgi:hypothetical protein
VKWAIEFGKNASVARFTGLSNFACAHLALTHEALCCCPFHGLKIKLKTLCRKHLNNSFEIKKKLCKNLPNGAFCKTKVLPNL